MKKRGYPNDRLDVAPGIIFLSPPGGLSAALTELSAH
jgi:hypothetical protein